MADKVKTLIGKLLHRYFFSCLLHFIFANMFNSQLLSNFNTSINAFWLQATKLPHHSSILEKGFQQYCFGYTLFFHYLHLIEHFKLVLLPSILKR
jgi:hypothetical protein